MLHKLRAIRKIITANHWLYHDGRGTLLGTLPKNLGNLTYMNHVLEGYEKYGKKEQDINTSTQAR